PVRARGDGTLYLASRFMRRHRFAFAAGVALLISLAAGAAGIAWQAREAANQRDEARAQATRMKAVNDYMLYMFRVADEEKAAGETVSARTVLEKSASRVREAFADDPEAARTMLFSLGDLYYQLGDPRGAESLIREFLTLTDQNTDPDTLAAAKQRLAEITFEAANPGPAFELLAEAQAIWSKNLKRYGKAYDGSRIVEAAFQREIGHPERSAAILESVASGAKNASAEDQAVVLNELGSAYSEQGRYPDAMVTYRRALDLFEKVGQGESSNAAVVLNNLCSATLLRGRPREAETCAKRSLALREKLYGESINSAATRLLLGQAQIVRGDPAAGLETLREGLASAQRFAGPDSALVARLQLSIARGYCESGRESESVHLLDSLASAFADSPSLGPHFEGLVLGERARLALRRGDLVAAADLLERAQPLVALAHGNRQDDLTVLAELRRQLRDAQRAAAASHGSVQAGS
ncbi:MAG TPA: tetratricopeptide repeat protein, partial [Nevskiaceae bacterium]|nr:tetratricopeptide repeat protein [Nevskiaceae bacterium]